MAAGAIGVVVTENTFRIRGSFGRSVEGLALVFVHVVTEVFDGRTLLMLAISCSSTPHCLERQKEDHDDEKAAHSD